MKNGAEIRERLKDAHTVVFETQDAEGNDHELRITLNPEEEFIDDYRFDAPKLDIEKSKALGRIHHEKRGGGVCQGEVYQNHPTIAQGSIYIPEGSYIGQIGIVDKGFMMKFDEDGVGEIIGGGETAEALRKKATDTRIDEVGIGINPRANFSVPTAVITEKVAGTAHIAVKSPHMDIVLPQGRFSLKAIKTVQKSVA